MEKNSIELAQERLDLLKDPTGQKAREAVIRARDCRTCNFNQPDTGRAKNNADYDRCKHPVITNIRRDGRGEIVEDAVYSSDGERMYELNSKGCGPLGRLWIAHPSLGLQETYLEEAPPVDLFSKIKSLFRRGSVS